MCWLEWNVSFQASYYVWAADRREGSDPRKEEVLRIEERPDIAVVLLNGAAGVLGVLERLGLRDKEEGKEGVETDHQRLVEPRRIPHRKRDGEDVVGQIITPEPM